MYPKEFKYTESHEWVKEEGDDVVSVGINAFAVEELGDIVFIELPEVGEKTEQNAPFGAIESVKAVVDLNAPVTGEIVGVNTELEDNLEILQSDPYNEGWMIKIKIIQPDELKSLMDADTYSDHLAQDN